MGLFITPLILIMAGPLAPFILLAVLVPGEFTEALGEAAVEIMNFFWITVPEFFGISLF